MITILHGDNIEESRAILLQFHHDQAASDIRSINGKYTNETELVQLLESPSMFFDSTIIIIENLLTTLGKKTNQIKKYTKLLDGNNDKRILLWESKEISRDILSLFSSKIESKLFVYPKSIFNYLDAIKKNNAKSLITQLPLVFQSIAPEVIWNMMINRVRQLMMIKDHASISRLQSWQLGRLTNQASSFTMDELTEKYTYMLDSEFSLKTGSSPLTMQELIRTWILNL